MGRLSVQVRLTKTPISYGEASLRGALWSHRPFRPRTRGGGGARAGSCDAIARIPTHHVAAPVLPARPRLAAPSRVCATPRTHHSSLGQLLTYFAPQLHHSPPQPHPAKNSEPVPRQQLHNSVAAKGQKAGATTKKGGAGGKGTWGKAGDEYDNPSAVLDKGDPNYDPSEAPGGVLEAHE